VATSRRSGSPIARRKEISSFRVSRRDSAPTLRAVIVTWFMRARGIAFHFSPDRPAIRGLARLVCRAGRPPHRATHHDKFAHRRDHGPTSAARGPSRPAALKLATAKSFSEVSQARPAKTFRACEKKSDVEAALCEATCRLDRGGAACGRTSCDRAASYIVRGENGMTICVSVICQFRHSGCPLNCHPRQVHLPNIRPPAHPDSRIKTDIERLPAQSRCGRRGRGEAGR